MLIYPIGNTNTKYKYYNNYCYNSVINFKGQLEDDYFEASKNGDTQKQIKLIGDIRFDINEIDLDSGNNFLHYAIKSGNRVLINKALLLLKQKTLNNRELLNNILSHTNDDNKRPTDYIKDITILNMFSRFTEGNINVSTTSQVNIPQISEEKEEDKSTINNSIEKPAQRSLKLNELPEGTKINIPFDNEDDEDMEIVVNKSSNIIPESKVTLSKKAEDSSEDDYNIKLSEIAGLTNVKKILNDRIATPLLNNKKVKDNGFLLYGPSGCGKGYLLKGLSNTLNREIINYKRLEQLIENAVKEVNGDEKKQKKQIEKILNSNIVKVEDVQQLESAIDFAKENYKNTKKQTIIYVDEIKGILPDVSAINSNSVTKAEQLLEDSSKQGFIIIATTREKDALSPDSIRIGRFDYKIELKLPSYEEREEIFNKYFPNINDLDTKEKKSILNKTAGFSYLNLRKLIDKLTEKDKINYEDMSQEIEIFAKENKLGEIKENGTTVNYDTKIKRDVTMHPANFSEVAGMKDIKHIFQENLIDRLKSEQLNWFKKHNRSPIKNGFLLYGEPGTGKTFLVQALAGEMGIPIYKLDAAKTKDKYVGESEKNIEAIFNQLETKFNETGEYSILFIDEAENLLGKREDSSDFDSSLVDLFLQKINNSAERGVITILATNFKDKLDSAVLSRLGVKINVPKPDAEIRKSMILLEKEKYPDLFINITDGDINEITARLSGFSSRDISTVLSTTIDRCAAPPQLPLCSDDFKRAINEFALSNELPEINDRNKTSAYDTYLKRLEITSNDPQTLDDLGGMKEVKEQILKIANFENSNMEIIERYNRNKVKEQSEGILLYGEPGCGKTYIMKALGAHLNIPVYEFKLSEQGSSYIHETSGAINKIFAQLKNKYKKTGERSILIIDEFEDIAGRRENNAQAQYKQEETNTLLKEIQNARKNGIIVVAATNFYNQIDDAMKRSGRFRSIYVPFPDTESRFDIIKKSLLGREIAANVLNDEDITKMAEYTEGFAVADITTSIEKLVKDSIDNNIDKLTLDDIILEFKNKKNEKEIAKYKGK